MQQEIILEFENNTLTPILFGVNNAHIHHLEKKLNIHIADRAGTLTLRGHKDDIDCASDVLKSLWEDLLDNKDISTAEIDAALRFRQNNENQEDVVKVNKDGGSNKNNTKVSKNQNEYKNEDKNKHTNKDKTSQNTKNSKMSQDIKTIKTKKKTITARSPNQSLYIDAIKNNPMVFGLGPAGTGKTYLAVAAGVSLYLEGKVERLIFCRPALEAGERLGFLPGDMQEKVDPYIRPIYDALHDMLPWDFILKKMEAGDIEIAPLAFMRGRTLSNAFVILDEAQNTTCTQMKMFLTRMGEASRMVITGDITQTDLPTGIKSGLRDAQEILNEEEEFIFMHFANEDVIRHPLVSKVLQAYDTHTKNNKRN